MTKLLAYKSFPAYFWWLEG